MNFENGNITFEEAKRIADEKAKEWNKVVVGISENDEYWLFNADNDSHPIDDGAGSCYISKKDGSIRGLNRWDMEFTKKFDETAKDLLVRTSLSELYGYHSNNNITDEKTALEYINNISNVFSEYSFNSDDNFVFLGRKKIIYDEINDVLKGNKDIDNPIYFVLGSLEEFICNNNFVYMSDGDQWDKGWEDLRNRNDIYSKNNVICLEEKNVIEDIINKIKDYIGKYGGFNMNLFEKDSNGAYIRLIIPSDFVKLILDSDNNRNIDLRGKKDSDLTTDEVILLKKYAYELSEKNIDNKNDRSDYFTYKQGDIQIGDSQCDFCKYNDSNNINKCIKYPDGKPEEVIKAEVKCKYLESEDR